MSGFLDGRKLPSLAVSLVERHTLKLLHLDWSEILGSASGLQIGPSNSPKHGILGLLCQTAENHGPASDKCEEEQLTCTHGGEGCSENVLDNLSELALGIPGPKRLPGTIGDGESR